MNPKITKYGTKLWYDSDDKLHREDGPAVECLNGTKYWFKHGKRHREDGPAFEYSNGDKYYWLENIEYTEEEYWEKINELNKCKLFKLNNDKIGWL